MRYIFTDVIKREKKKKHAGRKKKEKEKLLDRHTQSIITSKSINKKFFFLSFFLTIFLFFFWLNALSLSCSLTTFRFASGRLFSRRGSRELFLIILFFLFLFCGTIFLFGKVIVSLFRNLPFFPPRSFFRFCTLSTTCANACPDGQRLKEQKNREVDGSVAGPTLLLEEIDDSLFCFCLK